MTYLRVIDIIAGTTVDGPGLRTSIYFAGCEHHCPGCQNPQSWDINSGTLMSLDEIMAVIIENDFNVTFSGGDPFMQVREISQLAKMIVSLGKNIWCYTGYLYEEIQSTPQLSSLLQYIDVLVDGRFVKNLKDENLLFCGSSNQRLIDVKRSNNEGRVVIWSR